MLLANPSMISEIDKYAEEHLGISTLTLMDRAGAAVADAVRRYAYKGAKVSIFAGKGNNGGDGYAAALHLMDDFDVTVYDVFSAGQRSTEGQHYLNAFSSSGCRVIPLTLDGEQLEDIRSSDCVVDAVFGTGYTGAIPDVAAELIRVFSSIDDTVKIAVDVPLGIDAGLGELIDSSLAYRATATVVLGFIKTGLVSYPAKNYVGKLIFDNIGLHNDAFLKNFSFENHYIDFELATKILPDRAPESHKGSFGKLLVLTGSEKYMGAAHLSLEAALRSGVGYVTYLGEKSLCSSLAAKFPEVIYKPFSLLDMDDSSLEVLVDIAKKHSALLIGSGLGLECSASIFAIIERLLSEEGCPIILDADAINSLSERPARIYDLFLGAKRDVILTPHPLELSRISGVGVNVIQIHRLAIARDFAARNRCVLVLKGAGTVVTDGKETYINSSGSSALAKAGSGDVLAGSLAAFVASGLSPLLASALAVYLHGLAGDTLALELSEFGVTPSDLPREIAMQIAKISKHKKG